MTLSRFALVLALFVGSTSLAADRLVIAPFSGPKAVVARGQLLKSLCEDLECVPVPKATTRGKLDPKKLKKEEVSAVLTGKVTGKKIDIRLVRKVGGKPVFRKVYPVAGGKLSSGALRDIMKRVSKTVSGGGSDDDSGGDDLPMASTQEADESDDEVASSASSSSSSSAAGSAFSDSDSFDSKSRSASSPSSSSSSYDSDTDAELSASGRPDDGRIDAALFSAQVGLDFINRSYTVNGLTQGQLRDYSLPLFPAPRIMLKATPFAKKTDALAGLGAELDFTFMLGLKSQIAEGQTYPTSMTRFDLAALYNFHPISGSPLTITPKLGFRLQSFSVGAASDGTQIDGLPSVSYAGVRLAAAVEHTVAEKFRIFADLGFMPAMSTGDIGAAPFFPGASATGFEIGGGVGYLLTSNIEVRGSLGLTNYSLGFEAPQNPTFVAEGASDRYIGGLVSARYNF